MGQDHKTEIGYHAHSRLGVSVSALLVVDDEAQIRTTIGEFLSEWFDVMQASNAADALAILATNHVDVLVTDIMMPGMNGVVLAERAVAMKPDLKVLLISGYMAPGTTNGWKFVSKPFRMGTLLSAINDLTKRKAGDLAGSPA